MNYTAIQSALDARLKLVPGLPELQLENTRNIAKTGTPFSRATLLPAQGRQLSVGATGKDMLQGLYQIDLFYPADQGATAASSMADTVIQQFPRTLGLVAGTATVHTTRAWRQPGSRIETFYQVSVVVYWTCIV